MKKRICGWHNCECHNLSQLFRNSTFIEYMLRRLDLKNSQANCSSIKWNTMDEIWWYKTKFVAKCVFWHTWKNEWIFILGACIRPLIHSLLNEIVALCHSMIIILSKLIEIEVLTCIGEQGDSKKSLADPNSSCLYPSIVRIAEYPMVKYVFKCFF